MPDLSALLTEGERLRPSAERHQRPLGAPDRADMGFRIERPQAATEDDEEGGGSVSTETTSGPTRLYIYSDIGGWFGVWPEDVVSELSQIPGDIELHLHSPGGDAFDGVAIYNALKDHPGKVLGQVDGLAASAASVIAMACDTLTMKKGSQLMIHDAWGFAQGPAEDMGKMQTFLDKISNSIAEVYADRAGGSAEDWRVAMKEESWYTDREAVEAGLADKIETSAAAAKNHWDLKVFNHAGRAEAPAPPMPAGRWDLGTWNGIMARSPQDAGVQRPATGEVDYEALAAMVEPRLRPEQHQALDALQGAQEAAAGNPVTPAQAAALMHAAAQRAKARTQTPAAPKADGPSHTEGADGMPDRKKMAEALGLGPDATDAEMTAAYAAAFGAPTPPPSPPAETGTTTTEDGLTELARMAAKMGVTLVDSSQIVAMQQMAAQGKQAYDERRKEQRDQIIQMAIDTGRIELSRKDHWVKKWEGDPEGTRLLLESLAPNLVPMEAAGYAGSVATNEAEQRLFDLYPEMKPQGGRHG